MLVCTHAHSYVLLAPELCGVLFIAGLKSIFEVSCVHFLAVRVFWGRFARLVPFWWVRFLFLVQWWIFFKFGLVVMDPAFLYVVQFVHPTHVNKFLWCLVVRFPLRRKGWRNGKRLSANARC